MCALRAPANSGDVRGFFGAAPWYRRAVQALTGSATSRLFRSARVFSGLDDGQLEALAKGAMRRPLKRGEHVWRAGDAAVAFTVIASGIVKIVRANGDGTQAIVALFGPHETIGDVAAMERGCYPADAVVASNTAELVGIPSAAVFELCAGNSELCDSLNHRLLEHTHALETKIRVMTAGPVPSRLATLFVHLAERFGDELEDGATFIPVPLSRSDLACLVGARLETTIRAISGWQKSGILETSENGFTVRDMPSIIALQQK